MSKNQLVHAIDDVSGSVTLFSRKPSFSNPITLMTIIKLPAATASTTSMPASQARHAVNTGNGDRDDSVILSYWKRFHYSTRSTVVKGKHAESGLTRKFPRVWSVSFAGLEATNLESINLHAERECAKLSLGTPP